MRNQRRSSWTQLALAATALCVAPVLLASQDPKPVEPAQQLEQVRQDFEEDRQSLREKMRAAEDDSAQMKFYEELQALVKQTVGDMRAIADSAPGTETAAEAWAFVLQYAPQVRNLEVAGKAFDTLVNAHLASPVWKDLAETISYIGDSGLNARKVEQNLRTLMEKSPQQVVQAAAMFALGTTLAASEEKAKHDEGLGLLRRLQKEFAEAKEAADFVQRAEGTLFQLEKLQIGMPCPDFEASDENGVKFKLSEYKGKVVLLDFWGFW
jgi:hypothetical protein